MKYGLNLELTYEYKRFSFNSRSNKFTHNETGFTRKAVLDYFGNKLISYAVEINKKKYLKGVYNDLNELLGIFYKEKIGPNEPDRKFFITKYQRIIDDITIKIISNPYNINDDFDFDELEVPLVEQATQPINTYNCPECQSGLLRSDCIKDKVYFWKCTDGVKCKAIFSDIKGKPHKRLKNDFINEENTQEPDNLDDLFSGYFDFESDSSSNEDIPILKDFVKVDTPPSAQDKIDDFDDFDFTELDVTLPATEVVKETTNKDDFDFSEFDEEIVELKNSPTFFIHNDEYKLFLNFKHMTFTASGKDRLTVYALQNLATLVFINHEFLTANTHPDWLYSAFEDDLTVIFNKLTSDYIFIIDEEKAAADKYLEQEFLRALLNYRNKVVFFKSHKAYTFK
ncbi:hypothetical protein [Pseudomonas aeruginosa]|uniref:hypothetical protein n=1 Tax=Pseudomonas aeruginosa TaxID=287 RepID=UPI000FC42311|nr:hypothetical protein [Pseudomonas aeruginosa]RUE17036.1 hypothetical protein IPC1222_25330 [Pseudomonas aeruginosa]